jgi:hypothetical protein
MLTRNPEGQEELIIQLWQKAICKLFEIQFRIHNICVTKKEKKCWFFSFLQKKLRHTINFLQKIKKQSLVKL